MQVPIPDDWDGETFCKWSICWPKSDKWQAILSGLVESPTQGRFWDFQTGTFLTLRDSFRPAYDYNFNLKGVIMACEDTGIADALQAIATALANNSNVNSTNQNVNCCEDIIINVNGGVQGTIAGDEETGDEPIYGSEPPGGLGDDEFPDDFPGVEEYLAYKCQIATAIINDAIASLRKLSIITLYNATGLGAVIVAAIGGAIAFPPVLIPTMIAAIMALAIAQHLLDSLADEIEADKQNFICELYNAHDTEGAISTISTMLETAIAVIPVTGRLAVLLKAIAMILFNTDTINGLYENKAAYQYPDADCSGCGTCTYRVDFTSDISPFTARSGFIAPEWSSAGDGEMSLPGLGGGGANWSGAQITGADIADGIGVDPSQITSDALTIRVRYRGLTETVVCQAAFTLYDEANAYQGHNAGNVGLEEHVEFEYTYPGGTVHQVGYLEILGGDNVTTPGGTPCGIFIDWIEFEVAC